MSNLPAVVDDDLNVGLEDVEPDDLSIPRLQVVGAEAVFKDSLSGEKFPELDAVILGLIKQRVLWQPVMPETPTGPLCRSYDHKAGNPGKDFPWKASGFPRPDLDDDEACPPVSCADCKLKEWGTHPKRDNVPWCTEQYTFAVITENGPAILTFQGSGVKPTKGYLTSFVRAKTPMFTVRTKITLIAKSRGTVEYAVPAFQKLGPTDSEMWPEYAAAYRSIRNFLITPRADEEVEEAAPPPAAKTPSAPAADEDEIPF